MAPLLKDNIDRQVVDLLADRFDRVQPEFDRERFVMSVASDLDQLELKDRINLIADALAAALPDHYPAALDAVTAVAPSVSDWAAWPLCSFVERHGIDHPEASLAAMPTLTRRWSCEFAIRPFLEHHLDMTRAHLRLWATDDDETVRRLASEGTRPLLPWGPKVAALIDDPQIGLELLCKLRHDPSETVRRSVANHLNDVAKSDPELVIGTLQEWTAEDPPVDDRMVRHALRTLVKQGRPEALRLLGLTTDPEIEVTEFSCRPKSIGLGSHIELAAELRSTAAEPQRLAVDFVIHHITAGGKTSPKVFKWKTVALAPGQSTRLSKRRLIKNASTRTYHGGRHTVELQVAGQRLAEATFTLDTD